MTLRAQGCHVFAGGFTQGVMEVMPVERQVEVHDLGSQTVERALGVEYCRRDDWREWPRVVGPDRTFLYGNPRCTAFSNVTAGYGAGAHGPKAKATCDVHEFCQYAVREDVAVACWESVQEAYKHSGRSLVEYCANSYFRPNDYRVAHVLICGATFGNAQHRRRYFFVAYKDHLRFNALVPPLPERHTTLGDVLDTVVPEREVEGVGQGKMLREGAPHPDCHVILSDEEAQCMIAHLRHQECFNRLHNVSPEAFLDAGCHGMYRKSMLTRDKHMPFSMHSPYRGSRDRASPTLLGTCGISMVHPDHDRLMTVRELSAIMGWRRDVTPLGPNPFGQIAKGIVPAVGTWLAEQARLAMTGWWGDEDFDLSWDHATGDWECDDTHTRFAKVIDMTAYAPRRPK